MGISTKSLKIKLFYVTYCLLSSDVHDKEELHRLTTALSSPSASRSESSSNSSSEIGRESNRRRRRWGKLDERKLKWEDGIRRLWKVKLDEESRAWNDEHTIRRLKYEEAYGEKSERRWVEWYKEMTCVKRVGREVKGYEWNGIRKWHVWNVWTKMTWVKWGHWDTAIELMRLG